jgi:hypothetical protein
VGDDDALNLTDIDVLKLELVLLATLEVCSWQQRQKPGASARHAKEQLISRQSSAGRHE